MALIVVRVIGVVFMTRHILRFECHTAARRVPSAPLVADVTSMANPVTASTTPWTRLLPGSVLHKSEGVVKRGRDRVQDPSSHNC